MGTVGGSTPASRSGVNKMTPLNPERCWELIAIARDGRFSYLQHKEFAAQLEAALAEIDTMRSALVEIERRLREDTAPIIALINQHGDQPARLAWKHAIYASAIRAQLAVSDQSGGG